MREPEDTASTWVTVAEAAAALGVSERAIQKRAAAGKIGARRRETPQGVRWEIDANELARTSEPVGRERTSEPAEVREQSTRTAEPEHEKEPTAGAESANQRTEQDANEPPELRERTSEPANHAPDFMAHLMEENRFLRLALEARDRDAAELRAALREALKISTRALPEPGQPQVLAAATPVTQDTSQSAAQEHKPQVLAPDPSEPQRTTTRDNRGLRGWLLKMLRG